MVNDNLRNKSARGIDSRMQAPHSNRNLLYCHLTPKRLVLNMSLIKIEKFLNATEVKAYDTSLNSVNRVMADAGAKGNQSTEYLVFDQNIGKGLADTTKDRTISFVIKTGLLKREANIFLKITEKGREYLHAKSADEKNGVLVKVIVTSIPNADGIFLNILTSERRCYRDVDLERIVPSSDHNKSIESRMMRTFWKFLEELGLGKWRHGVFRKAPVNVLKELIAKWGLEDFIVSLYVAAKNAGKLL